MQDTCEIATRFGTPVQLTFLRAALTGAEDAIEAAQERLIADELDSLELGIRRLLPLFYRTARQSIAGELRTNLQSLYLQYWAKNQTLLSRLEKVLAWFQAKGVPTLVLKGMALSLLHYDDMAVRPSSDLDILVPEEQVREVLALLRQDGWTTDYALAGAARRSCFYRHIHAIPVTHAEYGELDLHWHVLQTATFRGANRLFWNDSVPLQVNAIATRALNPTDQLLHACVHGFAANVVAPIRWVADAITVLQTSQIDWQRLLSQAKYLHVTAPLGATLSFLRSSFDAAIPAAVIEELMSFPLDRSDRRYFEHLTVLQRNWREDIAYNWERHRRANRDRHPILRLASMPGDLGLFAFYRLGKQISSKLAS